MFDPTQSRYLRINFQETSFAGLELSHITFDHCDFRGANLEELTTRGCTFQCCNFSYARFNESFHRNSAFVNCQFYAANLFASEWVDCKCTGSGFVEADLTGITLCRGNYSYTVWQDCDLSHNDLSGINFSHADLRKANLDHAMLRDADLSGAMLSGASLTQADLRGSTLDGVYLKDLHWRKTKIDLTQAVLLAESMGAVIDE